MFARLQRGRRDDLCRMSAGRGKEASASRCTSRRRRHASRSRPKTIIKSCEGESVGAAMSGGPLSAIQMNFRRELAALAEQEEEEENSARSLLALMQKQKKKTVESGH